jgi:hypothetical protein
VGPRAGLDTEGRGKNPRNDITFVYSFTLYSIAEFLKAVSVEKWLFLTRHSWLYGAGMWNISVRIE